MSITSSAHWIRRPVLGPASARAPRRWRTACGEEPGAGISVWVCVCEMDLGAREEVAIVGIGADVWTALCNVV